MAARKAFSKEVSLNDQWKKLAFCILYQNVLDEMAAWRDPPNNDYIRRQHCDDLWDYIRKRVRMTDADYEMLADMIGINLMHDEFYNNVAYLESCKSHGNGWTRSATAWMDCYI